MTTEKTPHRWADVLRAIADGEEVQVKEFPDSEWRTFTHGNDWLSPLDGRSCMWRVAPKKQTVWVNVYGAVVIGSYADQIEANKASGYGRIACIPITFTEGEGL